MIPYFEILEFGKVKKRFREALSTISFSNELMTVPEMQITIPNEYYDLISGRKEMRVIMDCGVFYGMITDYKPSVSGLNISLTHVINEWTYRQVPTNYAVKNALIKNVYESEDMYYSTQWKMNFETEIDNEKIDYVYSRQSKLDALTKTCELTPSVYWRVPFTNDKQVEVGYFGKKQPVMLSNKPTLGRNYRIIGEPTMETDFSDVINLATVYANKSDSGMSSLSLREVYNDKSLQNPKFPVVILRSNINNERDYEYVDFPKLAPNNQLEYSIIDTESVGYESGVFIEGTFAFDDLSPFSLEDMTKDSKDYKWVIPKEQRFLTDTEEINNAKALWHSLKDIWSKSAIAALCGSCHVESTLNPNLYQMGDVPDSQKGFGLVQWTPYTRITNWLGSHGYTSYTMYGKGEVAKLVEEWSTNATNGPWIPTSSYNITFQQWSHMEADMNYMVMAFMEDYERGDTSIDLQYQKRIEFAQRIYGLIPEWEQDDNGTTTDTDKTQSRPWNAQNFINTWNGQSIDMDGVPIEQPYQCVDAWKKALQTLNYPNTTRAIGGDGYADYIWYNKDELGYSQYFDYVSTPQFGDWCIFGRSGDTPASHVAMYVSDAGNGRANFFGQNQPYPYCNTTTISTSNIIGIFRVKSVYVQQSIDPESTNGTTIITDNDRIYAAKVVYDCACRKLINARRKFAINTSCEALPKEVNVGDRIRFVYDLNLLQLGSCNRYMKRILKQDDWFYITSLQREIDKTGIEIDTLTLEKFLRTDRDGKSE